MKISNQVPVQADPADIRYALLYHCLEHHRKGRSTGLFAARQESDWALLLLTENETDPTAPLVLAHGNNSQLLRRLLQETLSAGKRYLFIIPGEMRPMLQSQVKETEYAERCLLYTCHELRQRPIELTELTRVSLDHGCYGYRRMIADQMASEARINWQTEGFAEIGVVTKAAFRRRGLAKATVFALTEEILRTGRQPLYVVSTRNLASIKVCESLGYRQTGRAEYETVAKHSPSAMRRHLKEKRQSN